MLALTAADALQQGCTALGNGALAVLVGSVVLPGAVGRRLASRAAALGAVAALALAHAGMLWWEASSMGDVPLSEAGPLVGPVLAGTHAGTAWWVVGVGLAATFAALIAGGRGPAGSIGRPAAGALAAGLLTIAAGRAAAGHAGSTGGPLAFAMDFVHLVAGSLWAGLVIVGAGLAARSPAPASPAGRLAMRDYAQSLSTLATVALAAILATGAFALARVLLPAPVDGFVGSRYGLWLGIKLGLVAAAVTLGAHNRFQGLPAVVRALDDAHAAPQAAVSAFRRVLVVESVVLALVLVAAAGLATSAPPAGAA